MQVQNSTTQSASQVPGGNSPGAVPRYPFTPHSKQPGRQETKDGQAGVNGCAGRVTAQAGADRAPLVHTREEYRHVGHRHAKSASEKADRRARVQLREGRLHARLVHDLRELGFIAEAREVASCGRLVVHQGDKCGKLAGRQYHTCHHKLDPFCCSARAARAARRLAPIVGAFEHPFLLYITIKSRLRLADADTHLRDSLKKLMRRAEWKRAVSGGYVAWETTHKDAGWHPHANIPGNMTREFWVANEHYISPSGLGWGPDFALRDLVERLWLEITGDSCVVRTSPWGGRSIYEAVKYPCKVSDLAGRPALVGEYLEWTKGRKLMWAFGDCRGKFKALREQLEADEAAEAAESEAAKDTCPYCAPEAGCRMHQPHRGDRFDKDGNPVRLYASRADATPLGKGWFSLSERDVGLSLALMDTGPPGASQEQLGHVEREFIGHGS